MKAAEKIETTTVVIFTEAEQKALKDYTITPEEVAEKAKEYMALKVTPDDSESYDKANAARLVCVHTRTGVDKRRKKLNEDDQARIKARNEAAKKLIAPLAPVEAYLEKELQIEDGRKAEIKAKKAQEELERVQGIRTKINGIQTLLLSLPLRPIKELSEILEQTIERVPGADDFQEFLPEAKDLREKLIEETTKAIAAREKLDKEDAERKAEAERLEAQKKEQEAEAARLAAEKKALDEAAAKVRAEQEAEAKRLEDERRKIQEEKDRAEFERKAKIKAEADAKAKVEREEQERKDREAKAEAERLAKEEADRKEAERREQLKPDKEKLMKWLSALEDNIPVPPVLNSKEASEVFRIAREYIMRDIENAKLGAEAL